jgi:hypothetical protein
MKFGWHNKKETATPEGDRLSKVLPAQCIGDKCLNWSGVSCQAYADLLNADGASGSLDVPPLREEANYALYGVVCAGGSEETLVAQRVQLLKPGVHLAMIIAISGVYGEMPLTVEASQETLRIETTATLET